ncbi:hypothetical protein [Nocardia macrotermitis]|uniref:Uncharacterized protein n=1 Tax=Nocardia macrotermitis TaxID=2585198 RepID=A0A7K0D6N8_9NOCA|nr:hypothetical protein [Nocardia macrotermitis]MQY21416.1 hypothetical protein [Nocardia macrotermitis]
MHPPPEPAIPDNVVKYGSADGWLDKFEAAMNASEAGYVALFFDVHGYDFASDLFDLYIGNNGPDFRYVLTDDQVWEILATNDVGKKIDDGLKYIQDVARKDPQTGTTREITTDWMLTFPTDNPDVVDALAHFSIAIGSDTTVTKDGNELLCEIDYVVYIYDYYNFDQSRHFELDDPIYSFKTNVDADMRQLEAAGWARSFRVSGDTSNVPMFWIGSL